MKIPHLVAKKKKKMDEAVSGISYILKQLFIVCFPCQFSVLACWFDDWMNISAISKFFCFTTSTFFFFLSKSEVVLSSRHIQQVNTNVSAVAVVGLMVGISHPTLLFNESAWNIVRVS